MLAIVVAVGGAVLGFVFAGSPTRIAAGVQIDGVDVGGLTAGEARTKLERRAERSPGCRSPLRPPVISGRCGR